MSVQADRRGSERFQIRDFPVRYLPVHGFQHRGLPLRWWRSASLKDLSEGGVRVHTVDPLLEGVQLDLEMKFPVFNETYAVRAQVRWGHAVGAGVERGWEGGLQFQKPNEALIKRIRLLSQHPEQRTQRTAPSASR